MDLTWKDCVLQALSNNPGLHSKRIAVEQYKKLYLAGYNAYFPKINISHSVNRSGSDSASPATRWGFSLSASEPLFDLNAMSSIRSSRISYEKAQADYKLESAALRQKLYSAYLNLIVAREQVRVDAKILEMREQNAKLIKLKYESGMESRGNMLYAQAQYEFAKTEAAKTERSLNIARRELLKNMGISEFRQINSKDEMAVPDYALKPATLKAALESIPQVISMKKSLEIYKERQLSAKNDLFPTLSASQTLGWTGPGEFPQNRAWSLGLNLSLPLFSDGLTYYFHNTKAARLALESAEESLKSLKLTLENDILNADEDFLNAKDTAVTNVHMLKANEERYKESQIKYMAGKISFIDLDNVGQNMVDAQRNQLQYLRSANTKKLTLENLMGVTLEELP